MVEATAAEDFTGVGEDFTAAEVFMEAEALAPAAGTFMAAIMGPRLRVGTVAPAGTVVPAGTAPPVGMEATAGMADIGAIRGTDMDGAGDGALASGGRIGVGGTRMAPTVTAPITLLRTLIPIQTIVLRVIHVRPTATVTLHRIAATQDQEAIRPSLGDRR